MEIWSIRRSERIPSWRAAISWLVPAEMGALPQAEHLGVVLLIVLILFLSGQDLAQAGIERRSRPLRPNPDFSPRVSPG
jgi:hypothetical protein